ncbi:hypothetical protein A2Z00_00535 [Candidatus Gottesmanbacteria bacterium RBG_13_45_10]|uniref:Transposase IS200-like domain-containing protein n=1 Tax=Candidatus Gottesmanbacteria bacterium RBG_13_45_10 TaxID=1798370 RepID=A0A1F5ZH02_9BACT|nr:MAG: hypothetical protein A2Z00_00535 [Candidatus Gottesmanbacteria bacterium RBG_13_45_10]
MPYRFVPFATDQTYHIFNRSVARQPIFLNSKYYGRMLDTINYYRFDTLRLRFSHYHRLPPKQKYTFMQELESSHVNIVDVLAFCLMPNHVHFLLRQTAENGISGFMRNIQNSYAKYFNTKTKRSGAVFQAMFKSVRMESEEQLLHVSRYIHLNPFTSFVIKDMSGLEEYAWSSYGSYTKNQVYPFVTTDLIQSHFSSIEELQSFTTNQADYQRALAEIKHLTLDNP